MLFNQIIAFYIDLSCVPLFHGLEQNHQCLFMALLNSKRSKWSDVDIL